MGRGRTIGFVALLAAVLSLAVAAGAQASRFVPDTGFGSAGLVNLLAVNQPGATFRQVREVKPGPNGTVWVHYRALPAPEQYECEAQSYLARYRPNGALDTSFGTGGFAPIYSPVGCRYPSLDVDRQLRPLITWSSSGGSQAPSTLGVVRYTTEGVPDPDFGSGGVALVSLPCPGGTYAESDADAAGDLLLSFGCRADESAEGWMSSPYHPYFARLLANGSLDTRFGTEGLLLRPTEPGWEPPVVAAVEPRGAAVLVQSTEYAEGVPQRSRLLRLYPKGVLDGTFQARAERSLRRVAALASPYLPEEATDFVLRRDGDLVLGGHSNRGGWVAALRANGSLEGEFGDGGYRRFSSPIRYLAPDRRGRIFALGQYVDRLTIYRLLADGDRDRSVGGREGQRLPLQSEGDLRDLVSFWHGLPLLYFTRLGSCTSPQDCAEPAELRRLRFNGRP